VFVSATGRKRERDRERERKKKQTARRLQEGSSGASSVNPSDVGVYRLIVEHRVGIEPSKLKP
jgi:hypothetical protein